MINNNQNIEAEICKFLQKNIVLSNNKKTMCEGKLILFNQKGMYLNFIFLIDKKTVNYELPYPFLFKHENKEIIFDYTLNTLLKNNTEAQCRNLFIKNEKKTNKLLNSIIYLKEKIDTSK